MPSFQTKRQVTHSAAEMCALVADIERYPEFVPLCERLKIRQRSQQEDREILIAAMTVAYGLFRETFTTRITINHQNLEILVEYVDGPFSHLENRWRFIPTSEKSCEVDFFIDWELRSRTLSALVGSVFERAFRRFAEAFEKRADVIYG